MDKSTLQYVLCLRNDWYQMSSCAECFASSVSFPEGERFCVLRVGATLRFARDNRPRPRLGVGVPQTTRVSHTLPILSWVQVLGKVLHRTLALYPQPQHQLPSASLPRMTLWLGPESGVGPAVSPAGNGRRSVTRRSLRAADANAIASNATGRLRIPLVGE